MMRNMMGSRSMVSAFTNNNKRRTMLGTVGTIGAMAGLGIAYMAYRSRKSHEERMD